MFGFATQHFTKSRRQQVHVAGKGESTLARAYEHLER